MICREGINLTLEDMQNMKAYNDELREEIIESMKSKSSDLERFAFVCSKFLNEYEFDYTALRAVNEPDFRRLKNKRFVYKGKSYVGATNKLVDFINNHKRPVCPSLHALKMGTCIYFSREIETLAEEFGVQYEHIERDMLCYDGYEKLKPEERIRKMDHHYSHLFINNETYKVDIAGGLMAMDYSKENKHANDYKHILPEQFVLTRNLNSNPFEEIAKGKKYENDFLENLEVGVVVKNSVKKKGEPGEDD